MLTQTRMRGPSREHRRPMLTRTPRRCHNGATGAPTADRWRVGPSTGAGAQHSTALMLQNRQERGQRGQLRQHCTQGSTQIYASEASGALTPAFSWCTHYCIQLVRAHTQQPCRGATQQLRAMHLHCGAGSAAASCRRAGELPVRLHLFTNRHCQRIDWTAPSWSSTVISGGCGARTKSAAALRSALCSGKAAAAAAAARRCSILISPVGIIIASVQLHAWPAALRAHVCGRRLKSRRCCCRRFRL